MSDVEVANDIDVIVVGVGAGDDVVSGQATGLVSEGVDLAAVLVDAHGGVDGHAEGRKGCADHKEVDERPEGAPSARYHVTVHGIVNEGFTRRIVLHFLFREGQRDERDWVGLAWVGCARALALLVLGAGERI